MNTFCLENLNGRDLLGKPGVDGRITLKCISKRQSVRMGTGFKWFRIRSSGRPS
jgi:hypothetical protein